MTLRITIPAAAELPELAAVAAKTFPLACPPSVSAENVAAFIDENLSEAHFAGYLANPDRVLLIAREDGRMIGYGAGTSASLMAESVKRAGELDAKCVWLGVNQKNERAQRFYTKHGFSINGTKTFRLGSRIENDYVMVRPV